MIYEGSTGLLRVEGLGFRVQGLGFRVEGLGRRVEAERSFEDEFLC